MGRHELCSQTAGAGMKRQAWGPCAPPPTASYALIKNPKILKRPQKKPGRWQGQHLHLEPRVPWLVWAVEVQGCGHWVRWWQDQLHHCPVSHCWEISLGLAPPRSFLSLIAGWMRKGGSLIVFQGPLGQECGHVSPFSPICQNAQAL